MRANLQPSKPTGGVDRIDINRVGLVETDITILGAHSESGDFT